LAAQIEQHLGGGQEEYGASSKDGAMGDVFGNHCFSESAGGNENDVSRGLKKVE
jgi:hypothetical protein